MPLIELDNVTATFDQHFSLHNICWQLHTGHQWVVLGANGAGKSALAALLTGEGDITAGQRQQHIQRTALVSFEQQKALLEAERVKDSADILDVLPMPSKARDILFADGDRDYDIELCENLLKLFNLQALLDRDFVALSTGETRKLLLTRALIYRPELVVLDEPFDGLDKYSSEQLLILLDALKDSIQMVLVLNRFDEIPEFVTDFAYVEQGKLIHQIKRSDSEALDNLYQLLHLKTAEVVIPARDNGQNTAVLDPNEPLVRMQNLQVSYGDKTVFKGLDWTIQPAQHWQLTGPNGSGKTCLLNLITGDNPQCYCNDIFVFGFQRGSGESIWQIKQHIGLVSNSFHLQYRVGASALNSIISGFYDSIGLYQQPTDAQRDIARQWLILIGLQHAADTPFTQLSFGDQRLVLIARGMVKHPALLILDEPCQGLDDINRQLVLALIERICAFENTAVIYVNHHDGDKINGIDCHLDLSELQ